MLLQISKCDPHELNPVDISPTHVTVIIPASYLVEPAVYNIQVVIYVDTTVPFGNYSNPALFGVWSPDIYSPIILNETLLINSEIINK